MAPPRDREKIASGLAQGNLQMGNASLNNASHDTLKGLAVDLNPSLRQGMTNHQARGGFDYSHFEYTAGNYDRMLGELSGGVQGGPTRRKRP